MRESKLGVLLTQMSLEEQNQFIAFLNSPIEAVYPPLQQLGLWLIKAAQTGQWKDKAFYFQSITGKKHFENALWYNWCSKLLQLVYRYIAQLHQKNQKLTQQLAVQAWLREHELDKHYLSAHKQLQRTLQQSKAPRATQYHWQYLVAHELDQHFLAQGERRYDAHLQEKSDAFDAFFILEKLRMACDMRSRKIVVDADYQSGTLEVIILFLQQNPDYLTQHPEIYGYYLLWQLLNHETPAVYEALKQRLQQQPSPFIQADLAAMSDYLLNYCIRQINKGQAAFYRELLDWYRFLLPQKLFYTNGHLAEGDYKNITTIALRLGEYKWTQDFIEKYRKELPEKVRESAYAFNKASLFFAQQNYGKALQSLQKVVFSQSTAYYWGAKIIQTKSYFMRDEEEALWATLEAFRSQLQRQKALSTYRHQANLHFIKMTKRLWKLKQTRSLEKPTRWEQRYIQFGEALQQVEPLANADWITQVWESLRTHTTKS